jgi:hypothetical protein
MGKKAQAISLEELESVSRQCNALHQDWQHFYQLATTTNGSAASDRDLALIQLQSRLSCDYPILSNARRDKFGLASSISKLVANAGTMAAFAREAAAGNGPLLKEWKSVNDTIVRVCQLLDVARKDVQAGKKPKLPKELAPTIERDPIPVKAIMKKVAIVCGILCACGIVFLILRPFILETALFRWLDQSYTAWQVRNGLPGMNGANTPR